MTQICCTCGESYSGCGDGSYGECGNCADITEMAREFQCHECGQLIDEDMHPCSILCEDCSEKENNDVSTPSP